MKRRGKAYDKNIISWFAMVYNFYPIRCLLSIPSPRQIKIKYHRNHMRSYIHVYAIEIENHII